MNSLNELVSHGINEKTSKRMLDNYQKRIGTINGVYKITDITYDFSRKGKIVTLECTKCGKAIERTLIKDRNKWSELIKTCDCEKRRKRNEIEKEKKDKILAEKGNIYGDYVVADVKFGKPDKIILNCMKCGAEKQVLFTNLQNGSWKDQKCHKHYLREIKYDDKYIGKKNNFLTVLKIQKNNENRKRFVCECECGTIKLVRPVDWVNGNVKSCGCKHDELLSTHGGSKDRLYSVWQDMKSRCLYKKNVAFRNYGGRGIEICDEWKCNYAAFKEWAYANGYDENAPFGECTLDRIDVNGNYEPSNCRWITNSEQQKNKRPKEERENRGYRSFISLGGEQVSKKEACQNAGISEGVFNYRVKFMGMSNEEALNTKKDKNNSIRVRLNDEMRDWLFKKSKKEKKTVSQLIRDLVNADMRLK